MIPKLAVNEEIVLLSIVRDAGHLMTVFADKDNTTGVRVFVDDNSDPDNYLVVLEPRDGFTTKAGFTGNIYGASNDPLKTVKMRVAEWKNGGAVRGGAGPDAYAPPPPPPSYKFLRWFITATETNNRAAVVEFPVYDENELPIDLLVATATASNIGSSNLPQYAANNDGQISAGRWEGYLDGNGELWYQLEFPDGSEVSPSKFGVISYTVARAIKTFKLQASNDAHLGDDATWVDLTDFITVGAQAGPEVETIYELP